MEYRLESFPTEAQKTFAVEDLRSVSLNVLETLFDQILCFVHHGILQNHAKMEQNIYFIKVRFFKNFQAAKTTETNVNDTSTKFTTIMKCGGKGDEI